MRINRFLHIENLSLGHYHHHHHQQETNIAVGCPSCHSFWEGSIHPIAVFPHTDQGTGELLFPCPALLLFSGSNKYVRYTGASYAQTSRRPLRFTQYTEALIWT